MCLGQEDAADLKIPLRNSEGDEALTRAIQEAISRKPKGHDFIIARRQKNPSVPSHLRVPGGYQQKSYWYLRIQPSLKGSSGEKSLAA